MTKVIGDDMQLVIELKNGEPVELLGFANSMIGAGNEYAHYLNKEGLSGFITDTKLYIEEIRPGVLLPLWAQYCLFLYPSLINLIPYIPLSHT